MNIRIVTLLMAMTLALPVTSWAETGQKGVWKDKAKAYRDQQKAENKDFRQSLKNVPEEQRQSEVISHRNQQFQENMDNFAKIHQERMTKLQAKLADNSNMSDTQKQEILSKAEQEYQDKMTQATVKHTENINYVQSVMSDTSLSPEQKKAKLQEYRRENKDAHQQAKEQRKSERQNRREQWKLNRNQQPGDPTPELK